MSSITDFIVELVRAANEVGCLNDQEKKRLLERSVTVIRDMRETIGFPEARADADRIYDIQNQVAAMGIGSSLLDEVRDCLVLSATMIRDLHIVLDTNTEVSHSLTR
jgi:predicted dinucleotide-utilizing enzyme